MPEHDQPSALERALVEACRFARFHGVEGLIRPEDFAIRRTVIRTEALYVDADIAVIVTLADDGTPVLGLADLNWLHWPDVTNGTEPCNEQCDVRRPETVVHLPGEAPAEVSI